MYVLPLDFKQLYYAVNFFNGINLTRYATIVCDVWAADDITKWWWWDDVHGGNLFSPNWAENSAFGLSGSLLLKRNTVII